MVSDILKYWPELIFNYVVIELHIYYSWNAKYYHMCFGPKSKNPCYIQINSWHYCYSSPMHIKLALPATVRLAKLHGNRKLVSICVPQSLVCKICGINALQFVLFFFHYKKEIHFQWNIVAGKVINWLPLGTMHLMAPISSFSCPSVYFICISVHIFVL